MLAEIIGLKMKKKKKKTRERDNSDLFSCRSGFTVQLNMFVVVWLLLIYYVLF